MRTLHLLRHAKSAWDQPDLTDRERGLNKRGRRDAPRMGRALALQMPAQSIAVSPAQRAQLTLEGLCKGWPSLADCQHRTEEDLYTFDGQGLLAWIAAQDDRDYSLFLIGHNPALTELINELAVCRQLENLPTAGYVRLLLEVQNWSAIESGCASLEQSLFPKELPTT
ncbi:MAG: histidine phosphatase family protein [Halioglobus sp.]